MYGKISDANYGKFSLVHCNNKYTVLCTYDGEDCQSYWINEKNSKPVYGNKAKHISTALKSNSEIKKFDLHRYKAKLKNLNLL